MGTRKASHKVSVTAAGTRSRRAIPLTPKGVQYKAVRETKRLKALGKGIQKLLTQQAKDAAMQRRGQQDYAAREKKRTLEFAALYAGLQIALANLGGEEAAEPNANVNELTGMMGAVSARAPPVLAVVREENALPNFSRFSIGR